MGSKALDPLGLKNHLPGNTWGATYLKAQIAPPQPAAVDPLGGWGGVMEREWSREVAPPAVPNMAASAGVAVAVPRRTSARRAAVE